LSYSDDIAKVSRSLTYIVKIGLTEPDTENAQCYVTEGEIPPTEGYHACINRVEWIPARATVEGGLGYLGEVSISLSDFKYGARGTYFGKMIGKNPYYLNRMLEIYVGYYQHGDTFNLSNFQKRTYFLKRIDGPDDKGNVKIQAADVLSRLNESEIPAATYGELSGSLAAAATGTINITDNTGFAAGAGYAIIGDEVVSYSATSGADSIIIDGRGQAGTTDEDHDAADPVRFVYQNSGNAVDVIRDIIEDYTDIDHASYIPDTDWNSERDNKLLSEDVDLWVIEPTKVKDIVDKLANQSYSNLWWDDAAQEIKFQALGPTLTGTVTWTDDENILDGKATIKRDQRSILTAVWVFFGKNDKTSGDDAKNFDSVYIKIDSVIEANLGEEKVKKIYADSLPDTSTATASKISNRLISQNKEPIVFTCYVDAKDSAVNVGDAVTIDTDLIQDFEGYNKPVIMRVIEKAQKKNNQYFYKLVKTGQEVTDRYAIIGPDTLGAYTAESESSRNNYGFIANNSNLMSNGDDPYLIQ